MNITDIFISLLRAEIAGGGTEQIPTKEIDDSMLSELLRLAEIHDVSETLFMALVECGALQEGHELFEKFTDAEDLCYFRLKRLEHSLSKIMDTLEAAGIDHMPLKGSVIRKYYPSPLMRMSADIDILVKEETLESAVKALCEGAGCKVTSKKSFHDISLYTPDGMHLELHFNIMENSASLDGTLARVWDYALPVSHKKHEFTLSPEFFAFHITTHMTYHFINGGCGVKPFSDLWIFKERVGYDEEAVRALCRECGIDAFYQNAIDLAQVWFSKKEHTDLTRQMEAHVIHNSICGEIEKGVATKQTAKGGRFGYIMSRIFMPYSQLKIRYRTLERFPILLPWFEVVRWFEFLFGDKKRAKRELEMTARMTDERMQSIKDFYSSVGLSSGLE